MDSDTGAETESSVAQKRPHSAVSTPGTDKTDSDTETDIAVSAKCCGLRRGKVPRGRGTGLTRAKAELKKMQEEAREEAFDISLRRRAFRKEAPGPILDPEESSASEAQKNDSVKLGIEELRAAAGRNTAAIVEVTQKSGNMKGPYIKKLKDSAAALQEIVDALASRTETDENRNLRADNIRLRKEIENLKTELKAHQREFVDMRTSKSAAKESSLLDGNLIEELKGSIVSSIGVMIDARFAGIEERLLPKKITRPPLAADKISQVSQRTVAAKTAQLVPDLVTRERSEMTKTSTDAALIPDTDVGARRPGVVQDQAWTTVVRKGSKKTTATKTATAGTTSAKPSRAAKPKLSPPQTAAVIITLQPEAAEKGVTYAQVLERAEQGINLQELGIGSGMRIRQAATGARLLELPKEQTAEQAENLAEKLRSVLDGVAHVFRPTKYAELRITGLDDSVTPAKVAEAIARIGNCSVDLVRVGKVKPGLGGMGMAIVKCPITVAKLLSDTGRVLVGWSSAGVKVLEQRPLRCYRCLGIGHTRPTCPSSTDRSNLCFRCGRDGHKLADCTSPYHCSICTESGKPSEHVMGGWNCSPPSTKGTVANSAQTAAGAEHQQTEEEVYMTS